MSGREEGASGSGGFDIWTGRGPANARQVSGGNTGRAAEKLLIQTVIEEMAYFREDRDQIQKLSSILTLAFSISYELS